MIENTDILSLNYYTYNKPFTGSCEGIRYRISKSTLEDSEDAVFEACVWPEPFAEADTEDELKHIEHFPFDEDGKLAVVEWLNSFVQKPE
ncbi:MAG: GNAT family acetyltransferase [Eubacterium sp.]|nr:GNAT family acetyltransferase [Eubacterium sp.]